MRKQSLEQTWRVALAAVAVIATAMALYVQLFERRSRQEEDLLAAARLDEALAGSRLRLKAEILAELRAELAEGTSPEQGDPRSPQDNQPLPDAVLRRGEAGAGSTLQQVLTSGGPQEGLAHVAQSLDSLAHQTEESDRALRRNLEEVRLGLHRDLETSRKALTLLLIAVIPLVAQLLFSIWPPKRWRRGEPEEERT